MTYVFVKLSIRGIIYSNNFSVRNVLFRYDIRLIVGGSDDLSGIELHRILSEAGY